VIERDALVFVYQGPGRLLFASETWSAEWGWTPNGWVQVYDDGLGDEELGNVVLGCWRESKSRYSLRPDGFKMILEVAGVRSERELGKCFPKAIDLERLGSVVHLSRWKADRTGGYEGSLDVAVLDDLSPAALGRAVRLTS
jgi:hypothetical protein